MTTGIDNTSAGPDPRYRQYADAAGIVNEQDSSRTITGGGGNNDNDGGTTGRNDNDGQLCDDGSCLRRRQAEGDAREDIGGSGRDSGEHVAAQEEVVEDAQNDFSIHDGGSGFGGFGPSTGTNTDNAQPSYQRRGGGGNFRTTGGGSAATSNDGTTGSGDGTGKTPPSLEPYVGKLERYELFSTAQCYYLVACDKAGTGYRVLKMDRTLIERPDSSTGAEAMLMQASLVEQQQLQQQQQQNQQQQQQQQKMYQSASADGITSTLRVPPSGDGKSKGGGGASSGGNATKQTSGVFPATNPSADPSSSSATAGGGAGGPTDAPHGPNNSVRPLCEFCVEDPAVYSQTEIRDMLDMIHEGNKYTPGYDAPHGVGSGPTAGGGGGKGGGGRPSERPGGGLRPICKAYGIVGFVRFLDCYYLTLITKRAKVGSLGGNGIYTIKATETFPLKPADRPGQPGSVGVSGDGDRGGNDPGTMLLTMWNRGKRSVGLGLSNREIAELRYQGLYQVVDLTKNFYFSYTYDVTRSLQENFLATKAKPFPPPPFKDMYAWNYFLTRELEQCTNSLTSFQWVLPIIHGAFLQRRLNDYGRSLNLTLLARRSRHFAGTRYLKRGVSDQGKVANDVEHEQILHDEASSASSGAFSSYLQVRGSIPTYWTQESSVTLPKPPIVLNRVDPTYHATQAHFADLLRRYGSPIVVVDLVKQSEKREREVIVGNEFRSAIDYLNCNIMDPEHKIRYCALDYSHISKHRNLNVSTSLNETATWAVNQTGFFCSCPRWTISEGGKVEPFDDEAAGARVDMLGKYLGVPVLPLEQKGVLRTNCIDCLDRTNVAQFSAGVEALGQQLVVMGIRNTAKLDPSSNIVRVLIDMFVEIGDHIALQYGGSEAHKKVNTTAGPAANIHGPIGKHKELLTSIRRYYSNTFSDRMRQDAMNLFLGYYIPSRHTVPLWELESDYYLHNFHVKSGRGSLHAMKLYQRTFGTDWDDEEGGAGGIVRVEPTSAGSNGDESESWRTERVRRRCKMQNEALSVWWRLAIQQYIQSRMWMDVGRRTYDSLLPSRFDRLYQPDKLAQFDKFFSRSWAAPVRLSHSAQHSHVGDDNTELMLLHRKAVVSADNKNATVKKKGPLEEKNTDTVEEEKSIAEFIASHGFKSELTPSLRLFLSSHSAYHRSIKARGSSPELSPLTMKDTTPEAVDKKKRYEGRSKNEGHTKDVENSSRISYLGDLTIKSDPCEEYLEYANFTRRPHPCVRKPRESAREEFAKCLQETNLNADDVKGIRKLAESAHICSELQTGPYRGLRETESAIAVTAVIHEQLNNVDSMRRRGEALGGGLPSVDDDLRQRRMDKPSVKEAIYNGCSDSTLAEQAYSEIIDTSSLGCRRSDLTDEKSMELYSSFFDQATPLSRLDKTYITGKQLPGDIAQSSTIRNRSGLSKSSEDTKEDAGSSQPSSSRWNKQRAEQKSPSLFSYDTRKNVPEGFEQINDDLFARRDNRFVVFNGTGLDTWRQDSKEPRTKVHGLEEDVLVGFSRRGEQ